MEDQQHQSDDTFDKRAEYPAGFSNVRFLETLTGGKVIGAKSLTDEHEFRRE